MDDKPKGAKAPFQQYERVEVLSPQNEDFDGPKRDPVSGGEMPKDPAGFLPKER